MKLENKISLITGGSRGIGRATAIKFASEGSHIILNYRSNDEEANTTCNDIKKFKVNCMKAKYDISRQDEAKELVVESIKQFGGVDILFNNAGIMLTNTYDIKDFEKMINTNLYSMVYLIEGLKENFMKRGGKIINVSSVAGITTALEGTTYYSITKGAVITLTRRYAYELGKYKVNVNAIAPGYIETDLTKKGKSEDEWKKIVESISKKTILGRIGRPEDIANVALFLASDDSDFITGQIIVADGGRIDYITHSL
ncbi:MAG: SDR family NAD(P)-dependent oxidoreductase [Thermoplasmata archaeon]|nr:glucose 1-dehydrogenase [Thermoplasmata archaeon]